MWKGSSKVGSTHPPQGPKGDPTSLTDNDRKWIGDLIAASEERVCRRIKENALGAPGPLPGPVGRLTGPGEYAGVGAWLKASPGGALEAGRRAEVSSTERALPSVAATALRDKDSARAWPGDEALISYLDGAARAKHERVDPIR